MVNRRQVHGRTAWLTVDRLADKRVSTQKDVANFKSDLVALLNSITLHCYRCLVEPDRITIEFIMWLAIHVVSTTAFAFIVVSALDGFNLNPLVTTLHDTLYPIEAVPFPAIAICNNNRISRHAAHQYARELSNADPEQRNASYFFDLIKFIGKLYDFDADNEFVYETFQEHLDAYGNSSGGEFDTDAVLMRLTPQCSEMLLRCFWKSIELPCILPKEMMSFRKTQYGHCCTFNYLRNKDPSTPEIVSYHADVTGPDMGLIILVNTSSSDYYYSLFNMVGFNIQIFNPYEYPDGPSGGVSERFVMPGTETFVRVDAVTITSQRDVARYSIEKRNCLTNDDLKTDNGDDSDDSYGHNRADNGVNNGRHRRNRQHHRTYKQSDCVVNCRIRSVIALCNCVPFYLPPPDNLAVHNENGPSSASPKMTLCTLQHTQCLDKYKVKWFTVVTKRTHVAGLERDMEESLFCPECLPSCSDTKYQVTTTSLPLIQSRRKQFSVTSGIENVTDVSVIRVFFGQPETLLYRQDVALYWFEIFSNFGGMCGIMAGFSLISGTEIVYFVIRQLAMVAIRNYRKAQRHNAERSTKRQTTATLRIYP